MCHAFLRESTLCKHPQRTSSFALFGLDDHQLLLPFVGFLPFGEISRFLLMMNWETVCTNIHTHLEGIAVHLVMALVHTAWDNVISAGFNY